jgi:hypothetical protein
MHAAPEFDSMKIWNRLKAISHFQTALAFKLRSPRQTTSHLRWRRHDSLTHASRGRIIQAIENKHISSDLLAQPRAPAVPA